MKDQYNEHEFTSWLLRCSLGHSSASRIAYEAIAQSKQLSDDKHATWVKWRERPTQVWRRTIRREIYYYWRRWQRHLLQEAKKPFIDYLVTNKGRSLTQAQRNAAPLIKALREKPWIEMDSEALVSWTQEKRTSQRTETVRSWTDFRAQNRDSNRA